MQYFGTTRAVMYLGANIVMQSNNQPCRKARARTGASQAIRGKKGGLAVWL